MYQVKRHSRTEFVPIRNLEYHVRNWGQTESGQTPLVMLHGWMDVGASYQFVVDAFSDDRYVIAPDWRGYGLTGSAGADNFWFPDYLADLDFLIDHYSPDAPVDLVGHSMGGNVAMLYAGSRPGRIRRLVNLEGFGMPATQPTQAPGRYAKWMDELKSLHRGEMALKPYESAAGVARRLMRTNKRLSQDKADWLAQHWSRQEADGLWWIRGEAAHKITNAQLSRTDELLEIYKSISAPTLCVVGSDNSLEQWWEGTFTFAEYQARMKFVLDVRHATLENASHMLHHDQPGPLARLVEEFL